MKRNKLKETPSPQKSISWGRYLIVAIAFFICFLIAYYRIDVSITYEPENSWETKLVSLLNQYLYNLGGKPLVYGLCLSLTFVFLFKAIDKYNKGNE